jgi:XTP/dITP diphosphohydrolase
MQLRLEGKVVFFVTNNIHKFQEASVILKRYRITAGMLKIKALEIQSDNLAEIAASSATDAYRRCHLPLIVEDAGLFVDELNGFPGPYAAYAFKTLANKGLLDLMSEKRNRAAKFRSVVAFLSSYVKRPMCFDGEVMGEIVNKERSGIRTSGFGFDPIFKPSGETRTFAEMSTEEKNEHSHRARALVKFAQWYKNRPR